MVEPKHIASKDNRRIKELKKLQLKKYRKKQGLFLIEGAHLVEEAIRHDQEVHTLIALEDYDYSPYVTEGMEVITVTPGVMKLLSSLETPPGIMAAVSYRKPQPDGRHVLLLDGIQDPGNLGTLLRTADAFGFDRVILSPDTVDPFSDKVLRSAQGSTFHIEITVADALQSVREFDGRVLGTSLDGAAFLEQMELPEGPVMVVLGNEGRGVSEEVLSNVDVKMKIDMPGGSESLNVAIAGGIIMHHFRA
ncbi:TrmH family RNA methyltransferase [Salinicoccus bachuensis]|uniref:RNA methyltransferase n=1 Tax=Salinicoccus bachuensis TaxID=3136731 RepID=A0ABZ3CEI6_9STAP